MAMDVYTDTERCWAEIDVPGVNPSSVELSLDGNVLRVLARRARPEGASSEIEVGEREHGLFSREFLVSERVKLEDVGVLFEHGVLTITVPEPSASSISAPAAHF